MLILLSLAAALLGCGTAAETGSMSINLDQEGSRLINPPLSMDVFDYEIVITGPSAQTLTASESIVIEGLMPGTYGVTVTARNGDGTAIGEGSASDIEITVSNTTEVNITVAEYTGDGSLSGTVSWEPDILSSPSITGYVKSAAGVTTDLTFAMDIPGLTATTSLDPLASGYYTLVNKIYDGSDLSAGFAEVLRIASGYETTYSRLLSVNQVFGTIDLNIELAMNDPLIVQYNNAPGDMDLYVDASETFSITSVDETGYIATWYINGEQTAVDVDSYTIDGSAYEAGTKLRLDCTVFSTDGSRAASDGWNVTITDLPPVSKIVFESTTEVSYGYELVPQNGGTYVGDTSIGTTVIGSNEIIIPDIDPGEYTVGLYLPGYNGATAGAAWYYYNPVDGSIVNETPPTTYIVFPDDAGTFDFGTY